MSTKPVQYFSDEYLEECKKMTPFQIIEFLENYRKLFLKKEPHILKKTKSKTKRKSKKL
jgi:hypothetical protein